MFINTGVFITDQYTERLERVQRTLQSIASLHIFTTVKRMSAQKTPRFADGGADKSSKAVK